MAICRADKQKPKGNNTSTIISISDPLNCNRILTVSFRINKDEGKILSTLNITTNIVNVLTANHFPIAKVQLATGFIINGSSDPRSRSPAEVSIAAYNPADTMVNINIIDITLLSCAPVSAVRLK